MVVPIEDVTPPELFCILNPEFPEPPLYRVPIFQSYELPVLKLICDDLAVLERIISATVYPVVCSLLIVIIGLEVDKFCTTDNSAVGDVVPIPTFPPLLK